MTLGFEPSGSWQDPEDRQRHSSVVRRSPSFHERFFAGMATMTGLPCWISATLIVDFHTSVTQTELQACLVDAWISARSRHPLLGTRFKQGPMHPVVEYTDIASEAAVHQWATSTLRYVPIDKATLELGDLEQFVEIPPATTLATESDFYLWYFLPSRDRGLIERAALTVWANHVLSDGTTPRIILSDIRRFLSDPTSPELHVLWGTGAAKADQRSRLTVATPDAQAPEYRSAGEFDIQQFKHRLLTATKNFRLSTPDTIQPPLTSRFGHLVQRLTKEESSSLKTAARRNNLTVTPVILAALVLRLALNYGREWPFPRDAVFADIFPADPRATLVDKRAVGLHSVYDVVTLRIGEHLADRSKQDVEQDLVGVILRLAEDGQVAYNLSRSVEGRAARARESERICETIMKTTEVNFGAIPTHLYSDAVIGENTLETSIPHTTGGLDTKIVEYDLSVKVLLDVFSCRAWMFGGQTSLTIDYSYAFYGYDEMRDFAIQWKRDLLTLCEQP